MTSRDRFKRHNHNSVSALPNDLCVFPIPVSSTSDTCPNDVDSTSSVLRALSVCLSVCMCLAVLCCVLYSVLFCLLCVCVSVCLCLSVCLSVCLSLSVCLCL